VVDYDNLGVFGGGWEEKKEENVADDVCDDSVEEYVENKMI